MIYVLFELRIRIYFTGLPRPSVTSIAKLKKFIGHGVTVSIFGFDLNQQGISAVLLLHCI